MVLSYGRCSCHCRRIDSQRVWGCSAYSRVGSEGVGAVGLSSVEHDGSLGTTAAEGVDVDRAADGHRTWMKCEDGDERGREESEEQAVVFSLFFLLYFVFVLFSPFVCKTGASLLLGIQGGGVQPSPRKPPDAGARGGMKAPLRPGRGLPCARALEPRGGSLAGASRSRAP